MRKITRYAFGLILSMLFAFNAAANDSDVVNCNRVWKIAVLGSSTAFGTGATVYDSSWVGKFTAYLKRKNIQNEIYNFGIPGFTTYQNLCPTGFIPPSNRPSPNSSFNITAALATNPDAIIINMPSNDAANNYTVEEQQANFERTMALADAANVPVWVTTTQPRNNLNPVQMNRLTLMRDWIQSRFGNKAVDFWTTVANADGTINNFYDFDFVHVNNRGHDIFYKRMRAETILDSLCARVTPVLTADAGNDISLTLPVSSATLNGSASRSSMGGIITNYQWNYISGPAGSLIGSPSSVVTSVTGLMEGRYSFSLTVTDNNLSTKSDTMNIVVSTRILIDFGPTLTTSPDANNNYWNTITQTQPGVRLSNAVTTGNLATNIGLEVINRIDGTFNVGGPGTSTGNTTGIVSDYPAEATTDYSFAEPSATNGQWKITGLEPTKQYSIRFWGSRTVNDPRVIQIKRADQNNWQEYDATANTNYFNAAVFTFSGKSSMNFDIRVKSGSAFGYICLVDINRTSPAQMLNLPPYAQANDITVPLPSTTGTLDGTASGDDDGVITAYQWLQTSGPSAAGILSPNSAVTGINNLVEGIYTFRLTVTDDSSAVASTTVTVTVNTRVLFDFGSTLTSGADSYGKFWNNIANGQEGIKITDAINTGNAPTGLIFTIVNRIDGTFNTGGPGTNSGSISSDIGDYPVSAVADYAFGHNSATNGQWKLSGLDNTKQYSVKFWGTRDASDQRVIQIKPAGETQWQEFDAMNNIDYNNAALFTFTGKTENTFDIRVKDNSTFGHISLVDIRITNPPIDCSPSVVISSNQTTAVCAGTPITFTAVTTNGGTQTQYAWRRNGNIIANEVSATYTGSNLNNNDSITCNITANTNCINGVKATSNAVAASILPVVALGAITGPTNVCPLIGSSAIYSVVPITNVNLYTWVVPSGATILNGQGTTSVTIGFDVSFDLTGVLSVTGGNCSNAIPSTLNLVKVVAEPPVSISGPVSACGYLGNGIIATYSVLADPVATSYLWAVPANVNIITGQGTNSLIVTFNTAFSAGSISVQTVTNCSISKSVFIAIGTSVTPTPGVITGSTQICYNIATATPVTYTIRKVIGATSYLWSAAAGASISTHPGGTGVNDTIITVTFNSNFTSGSFITVRAEGCIRSAASGLAIFKTAPAAPGTITGPVNVCPFIGSTATYTIRKVTNAAAYTWSVPAGASITAHPAGLGINDTAVVVAFTSSFVTGTAISVQAESCLSGAPTSLTLVIVAPSVPGAISGPAEACAFIGTTNTATYTIRKVAGTFSYIWTVPAGATIVSRPGGPGVNDTIITVSFNSSFVSGSAITVQSGGCIVSAASSITILKTTAAMPGVITGPSDICGFIGTSATYTIRKVTGATSYNWTIAAGASIASHPGGLGVNDTIVTVSFTNSFVSGTAISVQAISCATSTARTLTLTKTTPVAAGAISGPAEACAFIGNTNQATYFIRKVGGASSYNWIVPAGVTLTSHPAGLGVNDTIIKVTFNSSFVSGSSISVKAVSCGTGPASTLSISRSVIIAPGPITTVINPCKISNFTIPFGVFSVPALPGITYNWSTTPGAYIYNIGSTTDDVAMVGVLFPLGFSGGTVSVTASNACGTSSATTISIGVVVPSTISLNLTGPGNACAFIGTSTGAVYQVDKIDGVSSYTWTVPSTGTTVIHPNGSGENDTLIIVNFTSAFTSGNITVTANTLCGKSSEKSITVSKGLPAVPGTISVATIKVCPSRMYSYSVPAMPLNATSVFWTIPSSGTLVSGQGTTSIIVSYPSGDISGTVSAVGRNGCGSSTARTFSVSLAKCPSTTRGIMEEEPAITKTMEVLPAGLEVTVMPNPTFAEFKLQVKSNDLQNKLVLRITDLKGKVIETRVGIMPGQAIILGADFMPGMYIGELIQGNKKIIVKLVKL